MARLRREDGATIERLDEIRRELAPLGVKLDRWETGGDAEVAALLARPSLDDAGKERVLAAFDHRFRELPGYRARDLIVLEPATPGLDAGLAKFARCHRHDDDEVRYVVDGAGVFGFVRPDASRSRWRCTPATTSTSRRAPSTGSC